MRHYSFLTTINVSTDRQKVKVITTVKPWPGTQIDGFEPFQTGVWMEPETALAFGRDLINQAANIQGRRMEVREVLEECVFDQLNSDV